jgi:multiple sugar transport system permease protein
MIFAAPWIVGLTVFTLYPFAASIYYSFTDFSVLRQPVFVGLNNFSEMAHDDLFWKVLKNTLLFAGFSIIAGTIASLGLALLMNSVRRGQIIYSVVFYLPHLIPSVASAIVWLWVFNGEYGLLNYFLQPIIDVLNSAFGLTPALSPPLWLSSTGGALSALVLVATWGVGQTAFIYLAKLQDVPLEMYEAAEIDGATTLQKIWYVTLPMVSPIILFNIIMGIIGALQVFTEPYLIFSDGGPDRAAYFLPQYIYDTAFRYMRMGYASAMSWILFMLILLLTLLAFRLAKDRVYYAGK